MEIIYIIGSIQAVFFSFLLFTKKKRQLSDRILAIWLIIIGFNLCFMYLSVSRAVVIDNQSVFAYFLGFIQSTLILHWVFFYLYVKVLVLKIQKIEPAFAFHFLPAIILNLSYLPIILNIKEIVLLRINHVSLDEPLFVQLDFWLRTFVPISYLTAVFVLLKRHRFSIKHYFSDISDVQLNWLWFIVLTWIFVSLFLVGISAVRIIFEYNYENFRFVNHFVFTTYTVFVFGISFFGYRQQPLYYQFEVIKKESSEKMQISEKIQTIGKIQIIENETKSEQYDRLEKLNNFMKTAKPYLDSKLTLKSLAEQTNIPATELSFIINNELNQNFFDFVNHYRIEEVKKNIKSPKFQNYSLFAIAMESGFNSNTSFHRIFKKITGQTPAEYQKSQTEIICINN